MEEAPAASGPLSPLLGSVISSFCQEVFYLFLFFFYFPAWVVKLREEKLAIKKV